jgi:hypothetical protein
VPFPSGDRHYAQVTDRGMTALGSSPLVAIVAAPFHDLRTPR